MKIAMIGQKGIPGRFGGVERHVHDLSEYLAKNGYEVVVYGRRWYVRETAYDTKGVRQIILPSIQTKHFDAISHSFLATIHAIWSKADVIHFHGVGPSLLAWIPRILRRKTRVICTFHSIDRLHKKWGWFARQSLQFGEWCASNLAHETLAVSHTIREYIKNVYGREARYLPNGITMHTKTTTTNFLASKKIIPGSYILFISRLIPHKGAHYLIEAFKELRKRQPEKTDKLQLVIVGDGHYTNRYVNIIQSMAASEPRIIFTGFQSGEELRELYSHAALLAHASDNEGLPITVLEGMGYGLPVLLSDIPEHQALIADPVFLFRKGNTSHLSRQMETILDMAPDKLATIGEKNREHINREFSWDVILPSLYIPLYEEMAKKLGINAVRAGF